MSKIILLNGCGSAGKTQIARSIQHLSDSLWLRLGIDVFIDMMPPQYCPFGSKAKEGFEFVPSENERGAVMSIKIGPLANQVFHCMPTLIKNLADQKNNIIIDEVLFGDALLKMYIEQLQAHTVYFVGVLCDLKTMQERELLRGDRAIGLSNDQETKVHSGAREYDLIVDSTQKSPFTLASEILDFIKSTPEPKGFKKMHPEFYERK